MRIIKRLGDYMAGGNISPEVPKEVVEPLQITHAKYYHGRDEIDDNISLSVLLGFNPAKTAWCAGFVNAIEKKCGRKGTGKLNARSYLKYGEGVSRPQLGDIVVFKRGLPWQGHVGYYISRDADGILVLGGNQNNKVCYKYYAVSDVLAYRRP